MPLITSSISSKIFHPLWPILFYIFMAITTLQEQSSLLLNIHIETTILMLVILFTFTYFFIKKEEKINYQHPLLVAFITGMIFIVSPLITSLLYLDQRLIVFDQEFITLFKMILFGACFYYLACRPQYQDILLNTIILSYLFLGWYFLYRYLILNEIREFDLRPMLKIRHGDPNFLCTFFAMMIPIPLLQAMKAHQRKLKVTSILYILVALFFLLCAFLTESRMGLIAIVCGLVYLITRPLFQISRSLIAFFFVIAATVLLVFSGDRVMHRFSDIKDKSNIDRFLTWKNGLELFKNNPFVGVGMHQSRNFFYKNTGYPMFQSEFNQLEVHNTFLKVLAELGFIGFIFFMTFFLWPWKESLGMRSKERYFLISSLIILTLSAMTIGLAYKDLLALHVFLIAALAHKTRGEFLSI